MATEIEDEIVEQDTTGERTLSYLEGIAEYYLHEHNCDFFAIIVTDAFKIGRIKLMHGWIENAKEFLSKVEYERLKEMMDHKGCRTHLN